MFTFTLTLLELVTVTLVPPDELEAVRVPVELATVVFAVFAVAPPPNGAVPTPAVLLTFCELLVVESFGACLSRKLGVRGFELADSAADEPVDAPIVVFGAVDPIDVELLGALPLRVVMESPERSGGATVRAGLVEPELVFPPDVGGPAITAAEAGATPLGTEITRGLLGTELAGIETDPALDRTEPDPALDGMLSGGELLRGADMAPDELDVRPEETAPPELRPDEPLEDDPPDFPLESFWAASIRGAERNRTAVRTAARFAKYAIRMFLPSRPLAEGDRLLSTTMIGTPSCCKGIFLDRTCARWHNSLASPDLPVAVAADGD